MITSNAIATRDLETLRTATAGDIFAPGDHGYDEARRAWNLATDERPSVVVMAESALTSSSTAESGVITGLLFSSKIA